MQQFLLKIVFVALIGALASVKCEKAIVKGEVQTKIVVKGLPESNAKRVIMDHIEKALEWALQRIGYQEFSYDSSSIEVFSPMATDDGRWSARVAFVVNDFKTSSIDRIQLLARRYLTSTSYYGASIQNISLATGPKGPNSQVSKPEVAANPPVDRPKTANRDDDDTFMVTAKLSTNIEISGLPSCDVTTVVTNFVTTAMREAFDYGNTFGSPQAYVRAIAPSSPTDKTWSADGFLKVELYNNNDGIEKVLSATRYYLLQYPQYASAFKSVTFTVLPTIPPDVSTTSTARSVTSK